MVRRLKKYSRLTFREQLLFQEALLLHIWIGMLLKVVPFRRIPRLFSGPQSSVFSPQLKIIEMIRAAISRAGGVSPWKNRCLVSSLAARCMLKRRKIKSQIYLGLAKGFNGKMIAHAWLKTGNLEIVAKTDNFIGIYSF